MPEKRKPAHEMTSEELVKYALSPKVHQHLRKKIAEADQKTEKRSQKKPQSE